MASSGMRFGFFNAKRSDGRHSRLFGGDRSSPGHRCADDANGIQDRFNCPAAAAFSIQSISEAVRKIPDDWLADFPTQPWTQIKSIGNRMRHEYFRLDDAILWEIITTDAPALKTVMEAMLARHSTNNNA